MPLSTFHGTWDSVDGFYQAEISSSYPDGQWPAMVAFEITYAMDSVGGTITAEDARELAARLEAAAFRADYHNRLVKLNRV